MSLVDGLGVRVTVRRTGKIDRDGIERTRDATICRLKASGQSWRQIGVFLGLSHEGVRKRWNSMPVEVREHFGKIAVG